MSLHGAATARKPDHGESRVRSMLRSSQDGSWASPLPDGGSARRLTTHNATYGGRACVTHGRASRPIT